MTENMSSRAEPNADIEKRRTVDRASACCSLEEKETCCDPSAKAGCCGPSTSTAEAPSSCGCR